ncbi:MAG: ribonuclease III [Pseudomonadota bacterium]
MRMSLTDLCAALGYTFKDLDLLRQAITPAASLAGRNNERLEFLGDRVAGLVIADALYRSYPLEKEGDLAKRHAALVQGAVMAEVARHLNLQPYLDVGSGDVPASFLADAMEAIIGAVYLDGGMEAAETIIQPLWQDKILGAVAPPQDPKTALQEWAQARALTIPSYTITDRTGPDHAPVFEVEVNVPGQPPMRASGKSRREAEKSAAIQLLHHLTGSKS